MNKTYILWLFAINLIACSESSTRSEYRQLGNTPALLTTADLRLVTERPLPHLNTAGQPLLASDGRPVVHQVICTEPSPDVAKALSTLTSGQGGINLSLPIAGAVVNGAGTGAGTRGTSEQLAQLTERVPTIQALRDGLYRACEAYGNQALGRNAYALILSRYGELLTTLLLAEAMAGSYGHTLALLQGSALPTPPGAQALPNVQNAVPKPSTPPQPPAEQAKPAGGASGRSLGEDVTLLHRVADTSSTPAGQANPVTPARPQRPGGSSTPGTTAGSTILGAIGNNVPAAVAQMQYNYFKLNHLTPLLLLCANNLDPTLPQPSPVSEPSHFSHASSIWPDRNTCTEIVRQVVNAEVQYNPSSPDRGSAGTGSLGSAGRR